MKDIVYKILIVSILFFSFDFVIAKEECNDVNAKYEYIKDTEFHSVTLNNSINVNLNNINVNVINNSIDNGKNIVLIPLKDNSLNWIEDIINSDNSVSAFYVSFEDSNLSSNIKIKNVINELYDNGYIKLISSNGSIIKTYKIINNSFDVIVRVAIGKHREWIHNRDIDKF